MWLWQFMMLFFWCLFVLSVRRTLLSKTLFGFPFEAREFTEASWLFWMKKKCLKEKKIVLKCRRNLHLQLSCFLDTNFVCLLLLFLVILLRIKQGGSYYKMLRDGFVKYLFQVCIWPQRDFKFFGCFQTGSESITLIVSLVIQVNW